MLGKLYKELREIIFSFFKRRWLFKSSIKLKFFNKKWKIMGSIIKNIIIVIVMGIMMKISLFEIKSFSFDANLVIYINKTNIPPTIIKNKIYENQ